MIGQETEAQKIEHLLDQGNKYDPENTIRPLTTLGVILVYLKNAGIFESLNEAMRLGWINEREVRMIGRLSRDPQTATRMAPDRRRQMVYMIESFLAKSLQECIPQEEAMQRIQGFRIQGAIARDVEYGELQLLGPQVTQRLAGLTGRNPAELLGDLEDKSFRRLISRGWQHRFKR